MCTLLIIGLLQGLGIDPKNHGPLGFQNENEEDEEEPILHLVLNDEVVELDDLPVVVDDETEFQNEAVAPNTPAVPLHTQPLNFMEDGVSEEEDDPNNSSIHSDSHKRKRKSKDIFEDIILPCSKKGNTNERSSPSHRSCSPTSSALQSPPPVPVPKSPSQPPFLKSRSPSHPGQSMTSPNSPRSPSPHHSLNSPSPPSVRAGGGDEQEGSEEQGSPSSTGSSAQLMRRLAKLRSLSPTLEGEPLQRGEELNRISRTAPQTPLRTEIPPDCPTSPSHPAGGSQAPALSSRPARPKGYPCRGCGKSFTSKIKRTYHYEDNRYTCGETIKTDKIFKQF